jgi:hypothetical protein
MARKCWVSISVEIEVLVEVTCSAVHDDDGCGSPSRTGNSMTGNRGRLGWEVDSYDFSAEAVQKSVADVLAQEKSQNQITQAAGEELDGGESEPPEDAGDDDA